MRVRRVIVGPLQVNCWLVGDDAGGPLVVIDPGDDASVILREIGDAHVEAIVLTHGHFDHVGAVDAVRNATGAPLYIHAADAARMASDAGSGAAAFGLQGHVSHPADRLLAGGDEFSVGRLRLRVLHTPGHTPGGICLLVTDAAGGAPHVFTGDTLFSGSVGRTDLSGGDSAALSHSIAGSLTALDPETVVHPGHGPDSTIVRESRINPFWPRA